jgi:hypothetical protein
MSSIHERPSKIEPELGRILCSWLVSRDEPCPAKRREEENKQYRFELRTGSHCAFDAGLDI